MTHHPPHEKGCPECWGCVIVSLLHDVEGFHENLVDLTREADLADDSGGPRGCDRVAEAVESAAARGFRLGLKYAGRRDLHDEFERACEEHLGRIP